MTLYYDPKTRRPHVWVLLMPVIVPVLLTVLIVYFGGKHLEAKMEEERRKAKVDVFEKF